MLKAVRPIDDTPGQTGDTTFERRPSRLLRLLVIESNPTVRLQVEHAVRDTYLLAFADSRRNALAVLREVQPDVVSLDLELRGRRDEALRTLVDILRVAPATKVVVVTGGTNRADVQRALRLGAIDYLAKPIDPAEYQMVLKRVAAADEGGRDEAGTIVADIDAPTIIGTTPGMRDVLGMASLVATTDATVLIQGESGTGKELVARAIHAASRRQAAPFVAINCAAIPEGLLEAELFGHEKGAYTGAHVQRKGKLELGDTGTVFLDEIADLSLALQVKLLRFLQEREIERIGGRQAIRIDTRVIAATNKDLKLEVAAGRLREDLYFRLSVVTITLPPLRERGEDIGMLAGEFLRRNCHKYGRDLQFSADALDAIVRYHWPGNIRELENAIQRAVIFTRGGFIEPAGLGIAVPPRTERLSLREARNRAERQVVVEALTRTRGNISRAAVELGISRPTMHGLLQKHRIAGKGSGEHGADRTPTRSGHPAISSSSAENDGAR